MWALAAALGGLALSACSGGHPSLATRAAAYSVVDSASTSSTLSPAPSSTTSTSTTVATTTVTTAPAPGLGRGARGPEVAALEQRLDALHYDVGTIDDVFDQNTSYAVIAFQKVTGMERTGRATDDVVAALAAATPPPALVPGGGANRVEIDIPHQVLYLYESGGLAKILTISSGSNERFCSEGYCRKAVTPGGSFAFYRQAKGWEYGPLGALYNPQYFNGGIAVHGAQSVPAYPASHGCVRIPMAAAEWFPSHVSLGMPVYVTGPEGVAPDVVAQPEPTTSAPATTTPPVTAPPATTPPATTPTTTAPELLGGLFKPAR